MDLNHQFIVVDFCVLIRDTKFIFSYCIIRVLIVYISSQLKYINFQPVNKLMRVGYLEKFELLTRECISEADRTIS